MLKSERSRTTAGGYVWSAPVEASSREKATPISRKRLVRIESRESEFIA
jgi:hypothetical protein